MVQKKNDYWDQIFTNQVPETNEASECKDEALDFSGSTANQEHEQIVREILFAVEGEDAQKNSSNEAGIPAQTELVKPEAVISAQVDESSDVQTDSDDSEDFFVGWTQTTKTYSHLGFETAEKTVKEEVSAEVEPACCTEETESEVCEFAGIVAETEAVEATEAAAEEEEEKPEEVVSEGPKPVLSEDGSLCVTLNRYEHPAKGFGFGLLEEEPEEVEAETEIEEKAEEIPEVSKVAETEAEEPEEPEESTSEVPEGLDSWGSLAFELGLPVTVPESSDEKTNVKTTEKSQKEEKATETTKAGTTGKPEKAGRGEKREKPARERRSAKEEFVEKPIEKPTEKVLVNLDDEDFVAPENVFAQPEKAERPARRERTRREERDAAPGNDFGMKPVQIPAVSKDEEEEELPRRRRRKFAETPSLTEKKSAIGEIMAGVVASKMKDETGRNPRRSSKNDSAERDESDEEVQLSRRSRRTRRTVSEEYSNPSDEKSLYTSSAFESEDSEEETMIPNGARSRRRRRSQHEKLEQSREKAPRVCEPEEEAEEFEAGISDRFRGRSRRERGGRFQESQVLEDEELWKDAEVESDSNDDEEEEEEAPRGRRARNLRRGTVGRDSSCDFDEEEDDEEEHVFTEVCDDEEEEEEEEEDDEWETDFSQHDVPGWRYTIDFIVNSNLKARKREPSSMAGNIAKMNKRTGKRK